MSIAAVAPQIHKATGSVATVLAGGFSGVEAWGAAGGVLGALAALGALAFTMRQQSRSNQRAYVRELQEAEDRGRAAAQADAARDMARLSDDLAEARAARDYYRELADKRAPGGRRE